jgi:error-prone DNA polymerase
MGAELLGVYGVWQSDSGVRHLVAKRLVDLSRLLGEIPTKSRNFTKLSAEILHHIHYIKR